MIKTLQSYLHDHVSMHEEEVERVCQAAAPLTLRRNELAVQEGQVCRHKIFVVKGLLRHFGIAENGSEHILQFCPENTWTLDVESYDREIPSRFNIAAVENSEVLLWHKADFEILLREIPGFKSFSQQLISKNIYNSRQRLSLMLGATPEEKYDDFVRRFPGLLQRLPLHMIASYLGISLKTLTRIRHAQVHRS